jgi:hypothetical protein
MAEYTNGHAPVEADLRTDDHEFNPAALKPKNSKAWLNLLEESRKAYEDWNSHCDNVDALYASLSRLANKNRDKQFQIFWANCEVMRPSIFARPPVPVVVPKFKDRRPLFQTASEVLERTNQVAFDVTRIADVMYQIRDDLALIGRGVAWCRYESGKGKKYGPGYGGSQEKVCVEYKHRRDFRHSVSRCWYEVSWVAAASYLTRGEARERFHEYSGDAYQQAEYKVQKEDQEVGGADERERAAFWEIWSKSEQRVVWVAEGCEVILDEDEPHLSLSNFFPCPQPAYATCQRGSLVPVPDIMYYRDQLEEINLLTGRIHALSDALEVKGFYPAGGTELAEAVEAAVKTQASGRVLVPIANWAAFGGTSEVVIWMPIDMIVNTITALVTLRKEVINDIYQIIGLADIMRGATEPEETLGAQQLKTQYGSVRIRDKQGEMVRLSRDLVQIVSEIICGEFDSKTIMDMCQMDIPTTAQIRQQMQQLQQQIQQQAMQLQQQAQTPQGQQAMQNPQAMQQIQQMVQQKLGEANAQMQKLMQTPTQESVVKFLRDNRARQFILDIETDSTIQPDEMAEKKQRAEFMMALSSLLPQLSAMVIAEPKTAPFAGELLKFSMAPFRVGRQLDGVLDEFIQQVMAGAGQQGDNDPKTKELNTFREIETAKLAQKDKELAYQAQKDTADRNWQSIEKDKDRRIEIAKVQIDEKSEVLHAGMGQRTEQMKERQGWSKLEQQAQMHQQKMAQMEAQTRAKQATEEIKIRGAQDAAVMKQQVEAVKAQTAAAAQAARAQQATMAEPEYVLPG